MARFSLVGDRRWPCAVWSAVTIVTPLIVYVARGVH